jgi:outer membrane protein W
MKKITLSLLSVAALSSLSFAGGDFVAEVKPVEVIPDVVESSTYAVGFKVGTLGLGLDISRSITEKLNLRLNINGASYSDTQCESDVEYDYDLTLVSAGLLLDYYPMNNEFRVSAGAYYNGNEFELTAQPRNGLYTLNGVNYTPAQIGSLTGKVDFDEFAPYVGVGWGNSTKKAGWSFSVDAGIMYHGEPNVELTPTCGTAVAAALCTEITNNVEAERVELVNELSDYKLYPVVSVGVTYTF